MTDPAFPITGTCNCGAVQVEVSEPFIGSSYCHCTRCQRRTGTAASASARVRESAFRIVRGSEQIRSWKPADGAGKFFCGVCGSALYSQVPGAGVVGVRLGLLDADPGIRPTFRQYTAYAASWEPIPDDGLPRFDEAAPPS